MTSDDIVVTSACTGDEDDEARKFGWMAAQPAHDSLCFALRSLALCKGAFARRFFIVFHLLFLCWLCSMGYLTLRGLGRPGKEPCNVGWKLWVHTFLWKTFLILLKLTVLNDKYPFFPCVFTSKLSWSV
jgi:hypothetical protein